MDLTTTITNTERRQPVVTLLVLAALTTAGCGGAGSPFAQWIDTEESIAQAQRAEPRADFRGKPGSTQRVGAVARGADLPPEAGPEDFVRLALEHNPGVRAAEQSVHRLSDRIPQAERLDDPMLFVAPVGEMSETAAGQVGLMTGVSQTLPLPAKVQTRGRVAAQAVAEAVQELQRVRLEVVADTRSAWWQLYYTTRAIEVTEDNRGLLRQLRDVAEVKYRAGTADQEDVLRASVEMSSLDVDLLAIRQRQTAARAMLNLLIDRPVTTAVPDPPTRSLEMVSLELQRLLEQARQINPDIRRVQERIEGSRRRLELARLDRWPDLTVSVNYNAVESDGLSPVANGRDQWWVGFGVNLPLWAKSLDAAEHEAMREILQGIAALDDTQNRVAFRVQDAMAKVDSQQRQVVLFRDVIIPQARQAVDASLSSYRAGSVGFLTLVDNWRMLLDFELMYHRSLAQLEESFAQLQAAVGQDLQRAGDGLENGAPLDELEDDDHD
jgi:outer membrane protein TolC